MRITVLLTLLSFSAAMVIGTVMAAFRVSPVPPLRGVSALYVQLFRNTPLAVMFVLFFFGLTKVGVQYSTFVSSVIVLSIYTSTFVAETVRSGINSVAGGQAEAARALGLTFPQVLIIVVIPQALRTVVGPLGSLFIALIKNSSLASIVSAVDIAFVADLLITRTAQPVAILLGAAAAYLVLTYPAGILVGVIERKVSVKR